MLTFLKALLHNPWRLWTLFPDTLRRRTYLFIARYWGVSRDLCTVPRLPFNLALKRTHECPPHIEASKIHFVRRHTTIPVPIVFDVVPPNGKDGCLLLMSWIVGEPLHSWLHRHLLWPAGFQKNLDVVFQSDQSEERQAALANLDKMYPELDVPDDHPLLVDLRDALAHIRSLLSPCSGPKICSVNGGPMSWARCFDRCLLPPINTIAEFHELLFQQVSWTSRLERLRLIAKPVQSRDYQIKFTHSDLNPDNILVKDDRAILD
ncbi:hypothetical protein J3R30DRAFT_3403552 [Lentinula aciculospora]|uniref:Aminoglycoside phosphotransferase domain-containing protein n=1 Tax=Lentinula aciculospora TaxID=153920 RepID=A0A9W9DQF2_9AGAR|nr:hypothetical protein J3R30DRAFT_3403552 [Lentinula aciculospora]